MPETPDAAEAPPDETRGEDADSLTELLARLARDVSALVFCEAQLAASRNMPEVRRTARDVGAALGAALAFVTTFVFASVAVMLGLSTFLDPWLAALLLTLVWLALGVGLAWFVAVRAGQATGWRWWRVFTGPDESPRDLEQARAEAEAAVRATLELLAPVIAFEIASAAIGMVDEVADEVLDVGEDLIESADEMVEDLVEDLPGGGLVNQVWDVALLPGRVGLRIATTILKSDGTDNIDEPPPDARR